MLIDGEKWACEACIRGHRVSSCQHSDRPLSHINRKGRPMSQCPHCRGLRKARANHVKCECGSKPHTKNDCAKGTNPQPANRKQCCCTHGQRCTCSAKKDSNLATVPETSPPRTKRLPTPNGQQVPNPSVFRSEPTGLSHRHRPRKERQNGNPYSIPRSHTFHSSADLHQSVERLPLPGLATPDPAYSSYQEPTLRPPPQPLHRRAVSEHGSPVPSVDEMGPQVPAIDIPYSAMGPTSLSPTPIDYTPRSAASSYPGDVDNLWDAANLNIPSVDWSTFGFQYGSDTMTNSVSHPGSFASFDYNNYGHVTRSSSRVTSEQGDISPVANMPMHSEPQPHDIPYTHETADKDQWSLTASASSLDISRPQMVASPPAIDGSEAGMAPPTSAPSLIVSQEPDHYFSTSHGYPFHDQPQLQPPLSLSTVCGGAATQPLVTHAPLATTISEPAWHHPTSYPATTGPPLHHPTPVGGLLYSGQWSQ